MESYRKQKRKVRKKMKEIVRKKEEELRN